jgi:hypothetical protein
MGEVEAVAWALLRYRDRGGVPGAGLISEAQAILDDLGQHGLRLYDERQIETVRQVAVDDWLMKDRAK